MRARQGFDGDEQRKDASRGWSAVHVKSRLEIKANESVELPAWMIAAHAAGLQVAA